MTDAREQIIMEIWQTPRAVRLVRRKLFGSPMAAGEIMERKGYRNGKVLHKICDRGFEQSGGWS